MYISHITFKCIHNSCIHDFQSVIDIYPGNFMILSQTHLKVAGPSRIQLAEQRFRITLRVGRSSHSASHDQWFCEVNVKLHGVSLILVTVINSKGECLYDSFRCLMSALTHDFTN